MLKSQPSIQSIQSIEDLKICCASLYESDWAKLLLGDSFHPGGLSLTHRVGELLDLKPGLRLLDIASGPGTSAIYLAQQFGCEVVGIDFGADTVTRANVSTAEAGLAHLVRFEQGDAERLPFDAQTFDAVLCECAFCTFPNKPTAAREFARVLRPGGRLGLSDLTRSGPLPPELETLLAWVACIADALPQTQYVATLEQAGFKVTTIEPHNAALTQMARDVQLKLMGVEFMIKLKKLDFPITDLEEARELTRSALKAIQAGQLGYMVLIGNKKQAV